MTSLSLFTFMHWRRKWQPTPVFLPGESQERGSLVGCSPWGHEESDTTERLHFHFSLSCIGEGNGNPLQCSCLKSPRDGGPWRAAVYGVAQRWTRLKRLSSSSSSSALTGFQCLTHDDVREFSTLFTHHSKTDSPSAGHLFQFLDLTCVNEAKNTEGD